MNILRWWARQFFWLLGWKFIGNIPKNILKAVVIVAPHTSNWDGFYGLLFCFVKKLPIKFAIKKEAMFFPLGFFLKKIGAISIDRKKKRTQQNSMVSVMTALLQQQDSLMLIIAPEGTRKQVTRWKKGFYQVAQQAQVPIVLSFLDYEKKQIGFGPVFYPTGAFEEDLQQIQKFYKHKVGKYRKQAE